MGILEFIKKHYHRCNKKFLYLGAGLIVISLMLLTTFWGIYTTSSTEIRLEENTFTYQGMSPGESLRVHGKITEIEYYGGVVPDIPNMRDYPTCSINMSSDSYLEEKQILDNVSEKEKRFSNMTFSNKLIYGGVFSYVFFDNISFDHVDFIHTTFSHAVFMNVVFTNSTFLDCRFSQLEFHAVSFSGGYLRDVIFSRCVMKESIIEDGHFSEVKWKHMETYSTSIISMQVNASTFEGVKFQKNLWSDTVFYNTTFDIITFSQLRLENSFFPMTSFQNIFLEEEFDYTFIKSGELYIRIKGDITTSYNRGTSFYGMVRLVEEKGNISSLSGEDIHYHYHIFLEKGLHHSIRINGIFYVTILGGLTSITYSFGGKAIVLALVKFFLPFVFSSVGILVLYFSLDWSTFEKLGTWMILYFFPPLGKESVIPAAIAQGIPPWLIASSVAFIDIMVGLFLVWNFDLARKIPLIGGFIRRIENKGQEILEKKPWVERLAFMGLVLFVMFPFQGSGAVGATIIGRMLGMDPKKIWFAVIVGAIVGCFMIAYASAYAITFLMGVNLLYVILSVVIVIIFVLVIHNYEKFGNWVKDRL